MELKDIRKELDILDKELVTTISKRMNLIPEVAEFKKKNNLPIHNPEREQEILEKQKKLAEELGVSSELIEDILKRLIKEAHKIEKEIIEEK